MSLLSPATLAQRAEKNAYDLSEIPFDRGVDRTKWHFPEHHSPLFYTRSYGEVLDDEDRLAYNHIYATSVNEQFLFLEEEYLLPFLDGLARYGGHKTLRPEVAALLERFAEEEVKHCAMFRRLNALANPERYTNRTFHFFRVPRALPKALEIMARWPTIFVAWVWPSVLFEEKTVDYFQHYKVHAKRSPDKPLDPLYEAVHHFHALDEIRHVQIDQHLAIDLYDAAPEPVRRANAWLTASFLRSYTTPKRAQRRVINELCRVRPRLAKYEQQFCREIIEPGNLHTMHRTLYNRRSLPKLFEMFDARPELAIVAKVFPGYAIDSSDRDSRGGS